MGNGRTHSSRSDRLEGARRLPQLAPVGFAEIGRLELCIVPLSRALHSDGKSFLAFIRSRRWMFAAIGTALIASASLGTLDVRLYQYCKNNVDVANEKPLALAS